MATARFQEIAAKVRGGERLGERGAQRLGVGQARAVDGHRPEVSAR